MQAMICCEYDMFNFTRCRTYHQFYHTVVFSGYAPTAEGGVR